MVHLSDVDELGRPLAQGGGMARRRRADQGCEVSEFSWEDRPFTLARRSSDPVHDGRRPDCPRARHS
jgi:hypothetical protein